MSNKKYIPIVLATVLSIPMLNMINSKAEEIQLGEAYISSSSISSEKVSISTDGQYEITLDVPEGASITDDSISLRVATPFSNPLEYPLGVKDSLELSIEELWIDNVEIDKSLIKQPLYSTATDTFEIWGEKYKDYISTIQCLLYTVNSDDQISEINDSIRVVFTLSNLTDPDSFIASTVTTSTTEAVVETTTVITTSVTTSAEQNIIDPQNEKNSSPKTGDKGVTAIILASVIAGCSVYIFRKRETYEKNN